MGVRPCPQGQEKTVVPAQHEEKMYTQIGALPRMGLLSRRCSLVGVSRLFTAVASLLWSVGPRCAGFRSCGARA